MAQQWPVQLQNKLNSGNFSEDFGDTTIKSQNDIGLPKVRRRYTKGFNTIRASIFIDREDVQLFKDFYDVTLNGGVLPFEFTDPFSNTLQEFRFDTSNPPSLSPVASSGIVFNLTMSWERIPT